MKTKYLIKSFLFALLLTGIPSFAQIQTFEWQNVQRQYLVRTPEQYDGDIPVLYFLHGLGDNITRLDNEFHFQQIADQIGWAIEHGDRIAACAPVSGLITTYMANHTAVAPVRMLHIHGTPDPVVGYDGGSQYFGYQLGLSVENILNYWKNANGCTDEPKIDTLPDLQHIKVIGGNHTWYLNENQYDISYFNEIIQFFKGNNNTTNIADISNTNPLRIYPNPTTGQINIEVSETIAFDQYSSDVKAFVAFFDYDPAKKTLTPETCLPNSFTPSGYNAIVGYLLPQYGELIEVNEYFWNWWYPLRHFYEWDGMNFTEPEVVFEGMDEIMDEFYDDYMTYEMDDFSKYALIDIDEDGEPEIGLSTEDEEYQVVLSVVEGEVKILAGQDFKRSLFFYKGVVGDAGGCGTGCYYVQYTILKNSAPESSLNNMQSYNFETDGIDWPSQKDKA